MSLSHGRLALVGISIGVQTDGLVVVGELFERGYHGLFACFDVTANCFAAVDDEALVNQLDRFRMKVEWDFVACRWTEFCTHCLTRAQNATSSSTATFSQGNMPADIAKRRSSLLRFTAIPPLDGAFYPAISLGEAAKGAEQEGVTLMDQEEDDTVDMSLECVRSNLVERAARRNPPLYEKGECKESRW